VDYDDVTFDDPLRWPLHWSGLMIGERWAWFDRLWQSVCALRTRYGLPVRSGWWESELQVEALAALAAWVDRYDSGEWDDPPGKLALLFDLERVAAALRDGVDPFNPERDRLAFERHLRLLGCRAPPNRTAQ
jgi:pullulanase/glycogen debranching enzyme